MECSVAVLVVFIFIVNDALCGLHLNQSADIFNDVNQSPISLISCQYKDFPDLIFEHTYWEHNTRGFILHNTGHSVEVHYPGEPPSMLGGPLNGEYRLAQVHFHWGATEEGSEHAINNNFYAMEAHLVHYKKVYGEFQNAKNYKDGVAVVAVMFSISSENSSTLHDIADNLKNIHHSGEHVKIDVDSMQWLQYFLQDEAPQQYFTYFGSLTTPTFDEVVTWIVIKTTSSIGRDQLREFRRLLGENENIVDNRRELQKLNDRTVWCSPSIVHLSDVTLVITAAMLVLLVPTNN